MSSPSPETLGPTLVAAHMTGDYLLQSKNMAAKKLTDWWVRWQHVSVYSVVVGSSMLWYAASDWQLIVAYLWVFVTHFITDSHRWRTDNPWPAMPILQDQSLHAVQLAIAAVVLTA